MISRFSHFNGDHGLVSKYDDPTLKVAVERLIVSRAGPGGMFSLGGIHKAALAADLLCMWFQAPGAFHIHGIVLSTADYTRFGEDPARALMEAYSGVAVARDQYEWLVAQARLSTRELEKLPVETPSDALDGLAEDALDGRLRSVEEKLLELVHQRDLTKVHRALDNLRYSVDTARQGMGELQDRITTIGGSAGTGGAAQDEFRKALGSMRDDVGCAIDRCDSLSAELRTVQLQAVDWRAAKQLVLDRLEVRIGGVEVSTGTLVASVGAVNARFPAIASEVAGLGSKLESLEASIREEQEKSRRSLESLRRRFDSRFSISFASALLACVIAVASTIAAFMVTGGKSRAGEDRLTNYVTVIEQRENKKTVDLHLTNLFKAQSTNDRWHAFLSTNVPPILLPMATQWPASKLKLDRLQTGGELSAAFSNCVTQERLAQALATVPTRAYLDQVLSSRVTKEQLDVELKRLIERYLLGERLQK